MPAAIFFLTVDCGANASDFAGVGTIGCGAGCSRNVPLGGRSGGSANGSGQVGTQV